MLLVLVTVDRRHHSSRRICLHTWSRNIYTSPYCPTKVAKDSLVGSVCAVEEYDDHTTRVNLQSFRL